LINWVTTRFGCRDLQIGATRVLGADKSQSLAGTWRSRIDANDTGIADALFNRDLSDQIKLPGPRRGGES